MTKVKGSMNRLLARLLLLTFVLIMTHSSLSASGPEAKSTSRPNILFCMADDWGWPHAGAYGDKVIKTPAFDRLAREGVLFEQAFVSTPSCTASRNAILTGQQFYRLEKGANLRGALNVRYPNFMFMLENAGYEIAHFSKAYGPGAFKEGGYSKHPCGSGSKFGSFMTNRDKQKPFCFWLGTYKPHRGYRQGSGAESGIDVDKIHVPGFLPNHAEVRSDIADYYLQVQNWDSEVSQAIKLLEDESELENTIIVMTGDHGMPFPRCKANLYDMGVRVPLAIRWGSTVTGDRKVSDFSSLTDLAPTFLEAAGIELPDQMTGKSLLPLLKSGSMGRIDSRRDFMVFGRERHAAIQKPEKQGYPSRGIRRDDYLLILNVKPELWPIGPPNFRDCDDGPTKLVVLGQPNGEYYKLCFGKRPAVELYDCRKDPDQLTNLAQDPTHAQTVETLKAQLIDYLKKTGDPRFTKKAMRFEQ